MWVIAYPFLDILLMAPEFCSSISYTVCGNYHEAGRET